MLNKFFKFDERNTNAKSEVIAGVTTFLSMAYILGVNPEMLSHTGMPISGVFFFNSNCCRYSLHSNGRVF